MTPPPFLDDPFGLSDGWAVPGVTGLGAREPVAPPPVSPEVAALLEAVAAQAAVVPAELPGPQALADTAGLLTARAQLDRLLLVRLGDVDTRRLAQLDEVSTAAWLRQQDGDLPAGTVATARRLVAHPSLAEAVADGRLTPRQAEQIGRALAKARPALDRPDGLIDSQDAQPVLTAVLVDGVLSCLGQAFGGLTDDSPKLTLLDELSDELSELAWQVQTSQLDRLERAVVLMAQHLPKGWLAPSLAMLLGALLPTSLEDAARRAAQERRLTLTPDVEGGGHLCGRVTPELYELLHAVLAAAAETDPDNPLDTDAWRQARADGWQAGDDRGGLGRSRAQRLHDALAIALGSILDHTLLGARGKAAPHIDVTVPLATLNRGPGALPAVSASGQRLPLSLITRWMRDAYVTRFVLDLRHRVVETSHTERTLKAHERRIKHVETGHACQNARCPRGPDPSPGTRLVPHHPDAWAKTGTTSVHDTVMFCERDHTVLHHGFTLTLRDGRRINADGWVQ